jgi:hypothetical protein
MARPLPPDVTEEILRRYEIMPLVTDERVHHDDAGTGMVAAIGGHKKSDGRKMITLTIGNVSQSRLSPFSDDEGRDMVRRFCEAHLVPREPALERTLEHLVTKGEKMYATEEIDSFLLQPIHLHRGGYRIGSARMFRTKPLKVSA